jgi:small subunit ribosomal protein S24e
MDITVESEKENKLLERKEFSIRLGYRGATPSRKNVREALAKKLSADPDAIAIRKITNEFGKSEIQIAAHVYASGAACQKYEPGYVLARYATKVKEGETPAEGGQKEEKKPDKPAEEKKAPVKAEKPGGKEAAKAGEKKPASKEEPKQEAKPAKAEEKKEEKPAKASDKGE